MVTGEWNGPDFTNYHLLFTIYHSPALTNRTFQLQTQQARRFNRKLHRELQKDILTKTVDDERDCILLRDAPLHQIEQLLFADARSRSFMLDLGAVVHYFDVRERVRAGVRTNQHRIALRIVPRVLGLRHNLYQAAITVVSMACRDSFRDDRRAGVLAKVDHLRTGVSLLRVICQRDRIEFAD